MYGLNWQTACESTWNGDQTKSQRATSYVLILLTIGILLLILISVTTCLKDARQRKQDQLEMDNNIELTSES